MEEEKKLVKTMNLNYKVCTYMLFGALAAFLIGNMLARKYIKL